MRYKSQNEIGDNVLIQRLLRNGLKTQTLFLSQINGTCDVDHHVKLGFFRSCENILFQKLLRTELKTMLMSMVNVILMGSVRKISGNLKLKLRAICDVSDQVKLRFFKNL